MVTFEGTQGWEANFRLSWEILENDIKDTEGIKSTIKTNEIGSKFLTGFSLVIPPSSYEEARIIAIEKGNRVADYLSSIHNLSVEAYLTNITEIKSQGEIKKGYATLEVSASLHKPVDLDFANIKKFLACNDPKVLRQLAHYSKGLKYSRDPITQFREFYLMLEDEYGKKHPNLQKYSYIRHAIMHAKLDPKHEQKLLDQIGTSYIDPSSPEAIEFVKEKLPDLANEATQIVTKIQRTLDISP
jgi:hypothetical protein